MDGLKAFLITKPKKKAENKGENSISVADLRQKILVNTEDLMRLTGYGRPTAIRIGTEANAKVSFGKKIMWNVEAVKKYVDSISA